MYDKNVEQEIFIGFSLIPLGPAPEFGTYYIGKKPSFRWAGKSLSHNFSHTQSREVNEGSDESLVLITSARIIIIRS